MDTDSISRWDAVSLSGSLATVGYFSTETRPLTQSDKRQLAARASRFNLEADVTGLLLFAGGIFVQTFEGLADDVHEVFERILKDPWHRVDSVFVYEPIERRVYPAWTMIQDISEADPTLLAFHRARRDDPNPHFTSAQQIALYRTVEFLQHGAAAPWLTQSGG